jgi:hypothetical protein
VKAVYAGDALSCESLSDPVILSPVFGEMNVQLNGRAVLDAAGLHLTNGRQTPVTRPSAPLEGDAGAADAGIKNRASTRSDRPSGSWTAWVSGSVPLDRSCGSVDFHGFG